MQNFNIKRFAYTLRWQLSDRKGIYTFAAIGLILIFLPTMVSAFVSGVFSRDDYDMTCVETAASLLGVALLIYYISCGALIVSHLSNKQSRITAFMLPASWLEKFAARYLYLIVGLPLAFIIGFAAGDLLQMAVYQVTFGHCRSAIAMGFIATADMLPRLSLEFGETVTGIIALLWLPHSLFLLAGTFFRRHAWILSCLTLFFFSTAVIACLAFICTELPMLLYGQGIYSVGIVTTPLAKTLYTLAIVLIIAFNYWAAYRISSRMQAVNNKPLNF